MRHSASIMGGGWLIAACVFGTPLASAQEGGEARALSGLAFLSLTQPEPASQGSALDGVTQTGNPDHLKVLGFMKPPPQVFAQQGTTWLTFGAGTSSDFDELSDMNITAAWSRFVAPGWEVMVEVAVREFDMPGEDQWALNPAIIFRHHWLLGDETDGHASDWTLYLDIGIGVMLSPDDIPQDGTSFNFTPRLGVGTTFRISEDWRMVLGARWSHISNGRIFGDDDNPSSDGIMAHLGFTTSF